MSKIAASIPQMLVPVLPTWEAIRPFAERIDQSNVYSNDGPLNQLFCERFAEYIQGRLVHSADISVATVTNGTAAIELALRVRVPKAASSYVMMPSYTFIATAHAVKNAGFEPFFLDTDVETLTLTPEIVRAAIVAYGKPAAVIVVSPFGGPVDVEAWEHFEADTGVLVIFDLAASVTSIRRVSNQPICISLHATKMIGTGEGGAIISTDSEFIAQVKKTASFGFGTGTRVSEVPGGNYRISEYAAAIGLASLEMISDKISMLFDKAEAYKRALRHSDVQFQVGFGQEWIAMTMNVILNAARVQETLEALDKKGIPWRRWWSKGCHTHPAFAGAPCAKLFNTELVAYRTIGVPFHVKITQAEIELVSETIAEVGT